MRRFRDRGRRPHVRAHSPVSPARRLQHPPHRRCGRSPRRGARASDGPSRSREICGEEDLLIDGQLEGRLDLGRSRLVVGPTGKVRAAIAAREVDVQGVVNGNVVATERIILRKNSKLVGDLEMASVEIEDGAYFKGSIDITRPQEANSTAPVVILKLPGHPNAD